MFQSQRYVYSRKFPIKGQMVSGNVTSRTDLGFGVELPDYNDQTAFMPISELSRRRVRKIHSILKPGMKGKQFKVIDVDPEKDMVTISLRYVDDDDRKLFGLVTGYARKYNLLAFDLYRLAVVHRKNQDPYKSEFDGDLHDQIRKASIWKFFDDQSIIEKASDDLEYLEDLPNLLREQYDDVIANPEKLVDDKFFEDSFQKFFVNNFTIRREVTSGKMQQLIGVLTAAPNGVKVVQEILTIDQDAEWFHELVQQTLPDIPVLELTISSPPEYLLAIETKATMDQCLQFMKKLIQILLMRGKKMGATVSIDLNKLKVVKPVTVKMTAVAESDCDSLRKHLRSFNSSSSSVSAL